MKQTGDVSIIIQRRILSSRNKILYVFTIAEKVPCEDQGELGLECEAS
jgi:hypothetical protein